MGSKSAQGTPPNPTAAPTPVASESSSRINALLKNKASPQPAPALDRAPSGLEVLGYKPEAVKKEPDRLALLQKMIADRQPKYTQFTPPPPYVPRQTQRPTGMPPIMPNAGLNRPAGFVPKTSPYRGS